jgi:hypothetical protein
VLVTTQEPMMIRSFGFSSTFNAIPVLLCRHSRAMRRCDEIESCLARTRR